MVTAIVFSPLFFAGLFFCVTLLGLHEFYKLIQSGGKSPQMALGLFSGGAVFAGLAAIANGWLTSKCLLLLLPLVSIIFIAELYRFKKSPFENIAMTLVGVLYIAMPFGLLNFFYLSGHNYAFILLLGYFVILWINDTFAYLFGTAFGKHRLFERISPKKTWEGSIGGFLMGIITAWVISLIFKDIVFYQWAIISAIITVAGGYGDLVESMFKRSVNTKDTGSILPGHGGILDRFDCVFFSAPFVYIYIYCYITNIL